MEIESSCPLPLWDTILPGGPHPSCAGLNKILINIVGRSDLQNFDFNVPSEHISKTYIF